MATTLRPPLRRALLVAHVVASGAWLGLDAAKTILVFTARLAADPGTSALAYQALGTFLGWPLVTASLAALVTGVALGIGTKWGLAQYWWVTAKLAITVVLTLLVCFVLAPMLPDAAAYGRALAAGSTSSAPAVDDLIYPALVAPTALLAATLLAVVKPWGRVRRSVARVPA